VAAAAVGWGGFAWRAFLEMFAELMDPAGLHRTSPFDHVAALAVRGVRGSLVGCAATVPDGAKTTSTCLRSVFLRLRKARASRPGDQVEGAL
jgi:hypothetical protein